MRPKCYIVSFFLCFLLCLNYSFGQNIIKEIGKVKGEKFSYFTMAPEQNINGIALLLPSLGESPKSLFKNTSIPYLLAAKGYLTIVPELRYSLFADEFTKAQFNHILKTQAEKYNLNKPFLLIGGFSAGGAVAISYAEYLLSSDSITNLKGIFAIDPPLDLERLYISAENKINYNCGNLISREGYFTKNYLDNTLGGSPKSKPENYLENSPYSANANDGGNAKWLKNIAIRLYTEPDLEFVRKTYCKELKIEDINAFDLQKLSEFLLRIGNNQVEYIMTQGKGFHSWNIVEPDDFAKWVMRISK